MQTAYVKLLASAIVMDVGEKTDREPESVRSRKVKDKPNMGKRKVSSESAAKAEDERIARETIANVMGIPVGDVAEILATDSWANDTYQQMLDERADHRRQLAEAASSDNRDPSLDKSLDDVQPVTSDQKAQRSERDAAMKAKADASNRWVKLDGLRWHVEFKADRFKDGKPYVAVQMTPLRGEIADEGLFFCGLSWPQLIAKVQGKANYSKSQAVRYNLPPELLEAAMQVIEANRGPVEQFDYRDSEPQDRPADRWAVEAPEQEA